MVFLVNNWDIYYISYMYYNTALPWLENRSSKYVEATDNINSAISESIYDFKLHWKYLHVLLRAILTKGLC